jgi:hypothetical protein
MYILVIIVVGGWLLPRRLRELLRKVVDCGYVTSLKSREPTNRRGVNATSRGAVSFILMRRTLRMDMDRAEPLKHRVCRLANNAQCTAIQWVPRLFGMALNVVFDSFRYEASKLSL